MMNELVHSLQEIRLGFFQLQHLVGVFATIIIFQLARKAHESLRRINELNRWIQLAHKERDAKVHRVLGFQNTSGTEPLYTADETRLAILSKELDPQRNVELLSKRCRTYGRAEEGLNAITEEFYDEAYEQAGKLNLEEPSDSQPLLGVPICVKDCIGLRGTWSSGGLACRLKQKDKDDCVIIKALLLAGAIPICKGNVCQGMGLSESVNRIWGRSRNPWDLKRTPGGSSGGDAALVASGCVPLSISADGAGSIRIPASMCGVVGFKPSSSRMTFMGSMRPKKDNKYGSHMVIPAIMGPVARSVEDCAMFMRAVSNPIVHKLDRNVPFLPFDEKTYTSTRQLRIGYFMTDDWMDPCVTGKRAMKESIAALEKQGHVCVPFRPPTNGWETNRLFAGITQAEGNMRGYVEGLEGEPMIIEYLSLIGASYMPNFCRPILRMLLPKRIGFLMGLGRNGGLSAYELWDLIADMTNMKEKWSEAFNEAEVDAVIFPSLPIPATRHGNCGKIMSVSYMLLGNLLGWPCGAMPITTIREDEQHYRFEDLPKDQRDIMSTFADQEMKNTAGLPMSISVMSPMFEDEKCLSVMKMIEKGVCFDCKPTAFEAKTCRC